MANKRIKETTGKRDFSKNRDPYKIIDEKELFFAQNELRVLNDRLAGYRRRMTAGRIPRDEFNNLKTNIGETEQTITDLKRAISNFGKRGSIRPEDMHRLDPDAKLSLWKKETRVIQEQLRKRSERRRK